MKPALLLSDFPPTKTYLFLKENYNQKLLQNATDKAGSQSLLARQMCPHFSSLKIKQATISMRSASNFLRLDIIQWLINYTHISLNIDSSIFQLKGETTSRPIQNPSFPILFTPEFAALLANLYCDGHSNDQNSRTTEYYNQSPILISQFNRNILNIFGNMAIYSRYS